MAKQVNALVWKGATWQHWNACLAQWKGIVHPFYSDLVQMFGKCSLLLLKKLKEISHVQNILGWPAILEYKMTRPMGPPGPPSEQFKPLTLTTSLWLKLVTHLSFVHPWVFHEKFDTSDLIHQREIALLLRGPWNFASIDQIWIICGTILWKATPTSLDWHSSRWAQQAWLFLPSEQQGHSLKIARTCAFSLVVCVDILLP